MEETPKVIDSRIQLNFDNLVDSNISEHHKGMGKFYESKEKPDIIIRAESFEDLLNKHDNKLEISELVKNAQTLYKELEERYGISCPVEFFISKNREGKDVVCSVTSKIDGVQLSQVEKTEEFIKQFKKLYASIARYFFDKLREGGLYIWDINGESQYIYGKKNGDKDDGIYLIDTDIWLSRNRNDIYLTVYWLTRHMSWLETNLGVQLQEARDYIEQFISQPLPEDADESVQKNFNGIRDFLNGKKSDYNPESAIPRFE